jgi:hypothetical protein
MRGEQAIIPIDTLVWSTSMIKVVENAEFIEVQSQMPGGQRVLFLLLSLFPLIAPYELIIRPDWQHYFNAFFLFAAFVSAGAMAVSALFVWSAVAGLDSRLRFDRVRGSLAYSFGAPVVKWRTSKCPLDTFVELQVEKTDWSEGQPNYSLVALMADGQTFKVGSSSSREEIETIIQRITAFLHAQA